MPKQTTSSEKKIKAGIIHNNKYDYSNWPINVTYNTTIENVCADHGSFFQTFRGHVIDKNGCPKCSGHNLTTEERKTQASTIHNSKYDYSMWPDNVKMHQTVKVICNYHGVFKISLSDHIHHKVGCNSCRLDIVANNRVDRITSMHPNYNLSNFDFSNSTPQQIHCRHHGPFSVTVGQLDSSTNHCNECNVQLFNDTWKGEANKVHGHRFVYPTAPVTNPSTNEQIRITCKQHDYTFTQKIKYHLLGHHNCKFCNIKNDWKTKAHHIHDNIYDYSKWPNYVTSSIKVPIICNVHGPFEQTINNHIHTKTGCPLCYSTKVHDSLLSKTDFINESNRKHNNKYDYSLITHRKLKLQQSVKIICPDHGVFKQRVTTHLNGKTQCPICYNRIIPDNTHEILSDKRWMHTAHFTKQHTLTSIGEMLNVSDGTVGKYLHSHGLTTQHYLTSTGERELSQWIQQELGLKVLTNDRTILNPQELDIYIPSLNLAIEYCGVYWHSELFKDKQYHYNKWKRCQDNNIQLITLYEDEWLTKKNQVCNKIRHLVGKNNSNTVYARKTSIISVDPSTRKQFMDQHHIQGDGKGSISYALTHNDDIVCCMTFKQQGCNFVLNRYASSCRVVGGFSKLLSKFESNHRYNNLISFADRRISDGGLYTKTGWTQDGILKPDYYYVKGNVRYHKSNFRHSALPKRLNNYNPKLSEHQNCLANNVYKIWDCGKIRFIRNQSTNSK